MNKRLKVNNPDFWEERYLQKKMPWDIGQVAPAFVKYFGNQQSVVSFQQNLNVAILGCGRGHDAFYLAIYKECLFQIYGFDFSNEAIKYCSEIKEKNKIQNIYFYQIDFFKLVKDSKWNFFFDCVIEHTSLAAIDPKRREEYMDLIKFLLKPNGKLIGLFFVRPKELEGPPFGIDIEEVRELFKDDFTEIEELHYEECMHGEKLQGDEWFGVFEKLK